MALIAQGEQLILKFEKISADKAEFLRVGWIDAHPSLTPLGNQDACGGHTQIWELASNHRSRNIRRPNEPDEHVGVPSEKGEREEHKQATKFTCVISDARYALIHKWKLVL